jgi:hypothetical protein
MLSGEKLGVDRSTLYRIIEKARRIGVCLEYSRPLSSFILLPHGLQEVSRKELSLLKGNGNSEEDGSTKKCILF